MFIISKANKGRNLGSLEILIYEKKEKSGFLGLIKTILLRDLLRDQSIKFMFNLTRHNIDLDQKWSKFFFSPLRSLYMNVKLNYINMKFKDSDFEIITQGPGFVGGLKMIETVGRTCYQSQRKQTDDSCYGFVERMKSSEHYAMLEFFTVYLKVKYTDIRFYTLLKFYESNPYSRVNMDTFEKTLWITTNYRVIIENKRESDLEYLCEPEPEHAKRTTIRLFISRGISHESVRHRVASFAQSSQRYINYSKQHFGGEIIFIIPDKFYRLRDEYAKTIDPLTGESREYLKNLTGEDLVKTLTCIDRGASCWYDNMVRTEEDYKYLTLEEGWAAQDARDVLNNATSTLLNICMFNEDWKHYLDLRALGTTGKPHPDMKRISDKVLDKFIEDGIFTLDKEGKLCLN